MLTSLDELPGVEFEGVVLANELLDNLPFGIASLHRRRMGRGARRRSTPAGEFVEVVVPALPADAVALERAAAGCAPT